MRLLKIVPGYGFDNVRLHSVDSLFPSVGKEDVRVLNQRVLIAVIEIFELPRRDTFVDIHVGQKLSRLPSD